MRAEDIAFESSHKLTSPKLPASPPMSPMSHVMSLIKNKKAGSISPYSFQNTIMPTTFLHLPPSVCHVCHLLGVLHQRVVPAAHMDRRSVRCHRRRAGGDGGDGAGAEGVDVQEVFAFEAEGTDRMEGTVPPAAPPYHSRPGKHPEVVLFVEDMLEGHVVYLQVLSRFIGRKTSCT